MFFIVFSWWGMDSESMVLIGWNQRSSFLTERYLGRQNWTHHPSSERFSCIAYFCLTPHSALLFTFGTRDNKLASELLASRCYPWRNLITRINYLNSQPTAFIHGILLNNNFIHFRCQVLAYEFMAHTLQLLLTKSDFIMGLLEVDWFLCLFHLFVDHSPFPELNGLTFDSFCLKWLKKVSLINDYYTNENCTSSVSGYWFNG